MPAVVRASTGRAKAPPAERGRARASGLSPLAAVNVAGAIAALGLFAVLFTGDRAVAAAQDVRDAADQRLVAAGFKVDTLLLQGASPHAAAEILRRSGVREGDPILSLDLEAVRTGVESSGWVKSATVVRLLPDTLLIAVREKGHMAVWQHAGRMAVIDGQGRILPGADPAGFPQLPLVVGEGAETAAADLLPMIRARPRLTQHLEALVRVDSRRWDLRLKDGALIQLPATDEEAALLRLDQLDGSARVLELGFDRVDLRDPEMVVVRPRSGEPSATIAAASGGASQG